MNASKQKRPLAPQPVRARGMRRAWLRRQRSVALAAAACLLPLAPLSHAAAEWVGQAPIYYYNNQTQWGEVPFALDCQGLNNAGTPCATLYFWGYGGNWAGGVAPTSGIVNIASQHGVQLRAWYDSPYRGSTSSFYNAHLDELKQSGGGYLMVDTSMRLHTTMATLADLRLAGEFKVDQWATVDRLQVVGGTFEFGAGVRRGMVSGTGTVTVLSGDGFSVGDSTRLLYQGTGSSNTFKLYDDAVLVNAGSIDGSLSVLNQGSSTGGTYYSTLRWFDNQGTISGSGRVETLLRNAGTVSLGDTGTFTARSGGNHLATAAFSGGAGSVINLSGYHSFAAGTRIDTAGTVVWGGSYLQSNPNAAYSPNWLLHDVMAGSYAAGATQVSQYTVFTGTASPGALTISQGGAVFDTVGTTFVDSVSMSAGNLLGSARVEVAGSFNVAGGTVASSGGVTAHQGITFGTASVGRSGVPTWVDNRGHTTVSGALFFRGDTTFYNRAEATFDLLGDVAVANFGQGRIDNAGTFVKSAGAGSASVTTLFNNKGLVQVHAGRLQLLGGGTHSGSFVTLAGTALELGGDHHFEADTVLSNTSFRGPASLVVAGKTTLTNTGALVQMDASGQPVVNVVVDGTLVNQPGAQLDLLTRLTVNATGRLQNDGVLGAGQLVNRGQVEHTGGSGVLGALSNEGGQFTNGAHATLDVRGPLSNSGLVRNHGQLSAAVLSNSHPDSRFTNTGTLGFGSGVAQGDHVRNLGLIVNTGSVLQEGEGSFVAGQVVNHGLWTVDGGGGLLIDAADSFTGQGRLEIHGQSTLQVKGQLAQASGIALYSGLLSGSGRLSGPVLVGPEGRLRPGNSPGTLTIDGDLTLTGSGLPYQPAAPQLELEVVDARVHDRLVVTGQASFIDGVTVTVDWQGTLLPDMDDAFQWLVAGSTVGLDQLNLVVTGLTGEWQATVGERGALYLASASAQGLVSLYGITNDGSLSFGAGDYVHHGDISFYNNGRIDNGGALYVRNGSSTGGWHPEFTNVGQLNNLAGGFFQNRGRFYNAPGGQIVNAGQWVNHRDGVLEQQGVSGIEARFVNQAGATARNDGLWTLTDHTRLVNAGTLVNTGVLRNDGVIRNEGGRFEVGSDASVSGQGRYEQVGGHTQVDGLLQAVRIELHGGTLAGTGTLRSTASDELVRINGEWGYAGLGLDGVTLRPGDGHGGVLTIEGALPSFAGAWSTLVIDLAGSGASGRLDLPGGLPPIDTVTFQLVDGYQPRDGDAFTFLTGADSFYFNTVSILRLNQDGSSQAIGSPYWTSLDPGSAYLTLGSDPDLPRYAIWNTQGPSATLHFANALAPVPEPSAAVLLALGMATLAWRRRSTTRAGARQ